MSGWKKTSKLRVTGLCAGNSPVTDEFPTQRASNAENVSIWWRHHGGCKLTSINAYTILTNDILVCTVHLFGDTETSSPFGDTAVNSFFSTSNLPTRWPVLSRAWRHCRQSLPPWPHLPSCILQGFVDIQIYMLLFRSIVHLFILSPGFRSPFVVLRQTTDLASC